MSTKWLSWTQQLQAIAQNGLTYCNDPYDIERYQQLRHLAAEIAASYSENEFTKILDLFERQQDGYATPKIDVRGAVPYPLNLSEFLPITIIRSGRPTLIKILFRR